MNKFGIITDISPEDQPQGSLRFALNAISKGFDGNYQKYQSEPSNELCISLKDDYKQVGSIYMEDGKTAIFSTNNLDSEIGILDKDCNYTVYVNANLGFNANKPITGEYRVKNGCERIIYWGDDLNDDYFFNFDNAELFKTEGVFDPNKFKFVPDTTIPTITIDSVNDSGGNLESGIYRFQVEYVDEKLNTIYRSPISNSVAIYYDNLSSNFDAINGNFNLGAYSAEFGATPPTNKSITLTVNNLDITIKYLRINVIRSITGDGITRDAFVQNYVTPISDSTYTFTFSGITNDYISEDVSKLIIPATKYKTSKVREQVQNRYVRANITETTRDYSSYQRIVNSIKSNYVVNKVSALDVTSDWNSKNPKYNIRTFQSDEVYAFGIVFVHKDGTLSPVFHIPGRSRIAGVDVGSTVDITYDENNSQIKHLPKKPYYFRWEVYNTADSSGRMAYFETDTTYPEIKDCNGENIYGTLAGKPIRHHKFPSRKQVKLFEKDVNGNYFVNSLGIEFSDIEYPDSDIIGHYFVYAKRDETNKTVLDSGYITGARNNFSDTTQVYFDGFSSNLYAPTVGYGNNILGTNWISFWSPKSLLKRYMNGNYFNFTNKVKYGFRNRIDPNEFPINDSNEQIDPIYEQFEFIHDVTNANNISYTNNIFIDPRSSLAGVNNTTIINDTYSNVVNAYNLSDKITDNGITIFYYALNKIYKNPYRILENLIYYLPTNYIYTLNDSQVLLSGDAFISQFNVFSINQKARTNDERGHQEFYSELLRRTWVESDVNYNLIHGGINEFRRLEDWYDEEIIKKYILDKVAIQQTNSKYVLRTSIVPESYYYNKDYSDINSLSSFFQIPNTYNYCSKCLNQYKNRIIFSPKSFDEEIADFYRINFTDDYVELPSHRGEITGIKYKNNQLLVHTTETTFILQPNPQYIATNQNTAYMTTGDFLSIPPYELIQSDTGYGGMQNILANNNSESGYVWVDSIGGEIFSYSDKFNSLSSFGISEWLYENLDNNFFNTFRKVTGVEYPFKDRLGIKLAYDKRFNRLIITKQDYQPKIQAKAEGDSSISEGDLVFNSSGKIYIKSTSDEEVDFTNSIFCDKSFTISYSFDDQTFISWHSYLPENIFNTSLNFFTTIDNKIYKHLHKDNYLKFYDTLYPFIIEPVFSDYLTKNLNSIYYYTDFEKFNGSSYEYLKNISYNKAIFYNSKQSSGLLDLILIDQQVNPYQNINLASNQKSIIITDKNSKVSNLWDNSISYNFFSNQCPIQDSNFGYIDKLPINTDFNKSSYNSGQFTDKYLITRFFYFPDSELIRVIHKLHVDNSSYSIR